MIQWCDDCTHNYYDLAEVTEERYEFCMKCMTESKPGQMPIRYEQYEERREK